MLANRIIIFIFAAEIGDANGDGVVNVADIIAVVNAACGQESDEFGSL